MQFEAEWHAVPLGRLCCLAGIYSKNNSFTEKEKEDLYNLREIITDSLDMDAETVISYLDKIYEIRANILE